MINLDERYHDYLHTDKCFNIDGACEKVRGYGFECDNVSITGYYILTTNYKLHYNLEEQFLWKEELIGVQLSLVEHSLWERDAAGSNPVTSIVHQDDTLCFY